MTLEEPNDDELAVLERQFFDQISAASRKRTRRHRAIALGVGLVLAAGGTTAAVLLANQQTRDSATYCYSAADTGSRYTTAVQVDGQNANSASAAVEQCAAIWSIGFFDSTTPPTDNAAEEDVPTLEACLRNDGVMAVFPRDGSRPEAGFCNSLGLKSTP